MASNLQDAFVLQIIFHASGKKGAELRHVISFADYVNHAIITYDELNSSVGALAALDIVKMKDSRFVVCKDFSDWYTANCLKKHPDFQKELKKINEWIANRKTDPLVKTELAANLTRAEYETCLMEYLRSTDKAE